MPGKAALPVFIEGLVGILFCSTEKGAGEGQQCEMSSRMNIYMYWFYKYYKKLSIILDVVFKHHFI